MEIVTIAGLTALVLKIMDVVKMASAGQARPAVTQVVAWAVGTLVAVLGAEADITAGLVFSDGMPALGQLDLASLVLVGSSLGSGAGVVVDFKKARDQHDTAAVPPLGGAIPDREVA